MQYYELRLAPSDRTLHLFIGEYDAEYMNEWTGEEMQIDPAWNGCYGTPTIEGAVEPMIWVKSWDNTRTILHEVVHCVDDLMKCLTITDGEFRAYYTDWLYNEIVVGLKKGKK